MQNMAYSSAHGSTGPTLSRLSMKSELTKNGNRCFAIRPELVEGRREILALIVRLAHHQRAAAPSVTDVESGLLFIFPSFDSPALASEMPGC